MHQGITSIEQRPIDVNDLVNRLIGEEGNNNNHHRFPEKDVDYSSSDQNLISKANQTSGQDHIATTRPKRIKRPNQKIIDNMINSDILLPDKMLPDIIIIDTLQYLPNIFYLNTIDSSISEPPNTHKETIQRTDIHK
jgi:hypothetical protein